jgi:hypothetical protein
MLAHDTTKNGVEVVWCHLAVNVVPDFVVVVPFPEPWLYEKRYLFYGQAVCGAVLSRATLNGMRTISDKHMFSQISETMRQLPASKAAIREIGAEAQKTSIMTFFVNSYVVREGA